MSWAYYKAALRGKLGPVSEAQPEWGFWKAYAGQTETGKKRFFPLGIWHDGDDLVIEYNGKSVAETLSTAQIARLWISAARSPCTRDDYMHCVEHGRWPTEVQDTATVRAEAKPTETLETVDAETVSTTTVSIGEAAATVVQTVAQMGHNSQAAADELAKLRADLADDTAEMRAFYANNPIRNKTEADIAEDRRKRLVDTAKDADQKRAAEKKPHQDAADAVDAKWFPVIRAARAAAGEIDAKNKAWINTEQERLRKVAEAEARKKFELEREARIKADERRRQELAAKAAEAKQPLPDVAEPALDLPMPPAPVVVTPKILVGTTGNRRGAGSAAATATIVDLAAAAEHLAIIEHPELIALVQKCADRAAKAKAPMPGIRMSFEAAAQKRETA